MLRPEAPAEFAVEVRGLGKRFGSLQVLADISFKVPGGTTVCILGPCGSGKSTLLRCINFLIRPDPTLARKLIYDRLANCLEKF